MAQGLITFPATTFRGGVVFVRFPSQEMQGKTNADFVLKLNDVGVPRVNCPAKQAADFCALAGIAIDDTPDESKLVLRTKDGIEPAVEISSVLKVGTRKFPISILKVAPAHVDISDVDKKRMEEERSIVNGIYGAPINEPLWQGKFKLPGKGGTTSPFGSQRTYNGKVASTHYGLDLRGNEKTPVLASNAGKVVLAQRLFNAGNQIILDHGMGIFTSYSHMSTFSVKVGDLVKPGQKLGNVGGTGRATGPHLHWAVRVHHLFVDPPEFLHVFNHSLN